MTPSYQSGFYAPGRGTAKYPELWRDCVGAWNPGLGNSGLVLRDWSGRGNNGVLTNGPTWGVSGGRQALSFDGVDDYVITASSPIAALSNWSYSCWFKSRTTATQCVISQYTSGAAGRWSILANYNLVGGGNDPGTLATGEVVASGPYLGGSGIAANVWEHVVVVGSGATMLIYLNGALLASTTYSVTILSAPLVIGRLGNLATFHFNGLIDDIRAWSQALSAPQIRLLATRPGIAYERAPRKVYSLPAAVGTYKPYLQNYRSQIIGGGLK